MKSFAQAVCLIIIDLMAFYLSLFLAVLIRTNIVHLFWKNIPTFTFSLNYMFSIWWIPLIVVFIIQSLRLYYSRYPFWEETRNLVKAITFSIILAFFIIYARQMYSHVVFRLVFTLLWLFSIVIFPLFRYFGKKLLYKVGIWKENVIILGAGTNAVATIQGLIRESHIGYNVVGILDDNPKKIGTYIEANNKQYKVYGEIDNFNKFVDVLDIQTVFIAVKLSPQKLSKLINRVYRYVRRVIIVPDIKGVSIFNSELHYLFTERIFMINMHNSLNSRTNIFIKRVFDIVFFILIFVFVFPIILFLIVLIKIDSKGPVFFRQDRVGKDGKIFKVLKFRTMIVNAEEKLKKILANDKTARDYYNKYWKLPDDSRVTRIGKFLRKTSLDEIPQIFNVFLGEMSFVGPRPYMPSEIDKLADASNIIHSVPPGLTGLWQVSGRSETNYDFRVQTDVWYIQNWNLWLDIIIIMRTPLVIIKAKGAY